MPVILLRHTRPDVPEGTCYGRSDLALADDFDVAAAAVEAALPEVSAIATSPLRRCRLLAERLARVRSLPLAADVRIAEMDFGSWEGVAWSEIPRAELDAWAADFHGARPHGGESLTMLSDRVRQALDATHAAVPPVLWVTHSGVIRAVCAQLGQARGWHTDVAFGSWHDARAGGATGAEIPA